MGNPSPDDLEALLSASETSFRRAIAIICRALELPQLDVELSADADEMDDGDNDEPPRVTQSVEDDPLTAAYLDRVLEEGLVSRADLRRALTVVRNPEREKAAVSEEAKDAVIEVGLRAVKGEPQHSPLFREYWRPHASSLADLASIGIEMVLNRDGIPSFDLGGDEARPEPPVVSAVRHGTDQAQPTLRTPAILSEACARPRTRIGIRNVSPLPKSAPLIFRLIHVSHSEQLLYDA